MKKSIDVLSIFWTDLKMDKILLSFIIVFFSFELNGKDTPVNNSSFTNPGIEKIATSHPGEAFQQTRDFGRRPCKLWIS